MKAFERGGGRGRILSKIRAAFFVLPLAGLFSCSFTQQISRPLVAGPTEEEEMGRQMARQLAQQVTIVADPAIEVPFEEVGRKIVAVVGAQPFQFHFFVIESPVFNAFSLPGGYVYFYTGLLVRAENVDELAGVMAHEIAHVVRHHGAKLMAEQSLLSLAAIPAILAALMTGTLPAAFAAQAGLEAQALHSSRQAEAEADEYGARYARAAGFNPKGMVTFFERTRRDLRLGLEQSIPYLLDHPLEEERIHDLETLVDMSEPWTAGPAAAHFRRLQAGVRALIQGPAAVHAYVQETERDPRSPEAWALLGVAQRLAGDCRTAERSLLEARRLGGPSADVDADEGECWLRLGDPDRAMQAFARAAKEDPDQGDRWLRLGKIESEAGRPDQAVADLMHASSLLGDTAEVNQSLGVAYGKTGDVARAHLYLGRAALRQGDYEQASFHFREAMTRAGHGSDVEREASREIRGLPPPR